MSPQLKELIVMMLVFGTGFGFIPLLGGKLLESMSPEKWKTQAMATGVILFHVLPVLLSVWVLSLPPP